LNFHKSRVFPAFSAVACLLLNGQKAVAMIDGMFSQPDYVASKKMLDATVMRQEAIASNLANLETPGYKRMDVSPSFQSQLSQAVASGNPAQITAIQPELSVDTQSVSSRTDGNTVQLESEMLKLNKNMIEHTLETQLVSNTMWRMRLAITGKS
jgi:flagellar basal-body rod protein FlgB